LVTGIELWLMIEDTMEIVLSPNLYFSYSQFFIYDKGIGKRACDWTKDHSRQGFARREHTVAVGTLLEFGHAQVCVHAGSPRSIEMFDRVISVPLRIETGRLAVDSVEEYSIDRSIEITSGTYRVIIAQRAIDDQIEEIVIYLDEFKKGEPIRSEILLADDALDPPSTLLESASEPELR
jgi:hypothetical protein